MLEATLEPNRPLLERAVHLSNGRREVLRADGIHHLIDADAECREIGRPNVYAELGAVAPDDVHLGNAGDRPQIAGDGRIGQRRELRRRQHCRRQRQGDDRQLIGIEALNDRLENLGRKLRAHRGDRVPYVLRRLIDGFTKHELHEDLRKSVA